MSLGSSTQLPAEQSHRLCTAEKRRCGQPLHGRRQ
jgi:hypothetical protein